VYTVTWFPTNIISPVKAAETGKDISIDSGVDNELATCTGVGDGIGVGVSVGVGTAGVSDAAGAGSIVISGLCAAVGTGAAVSPIDSLANETEGIWQANTTAARSAASLILNFFAFSRFMLFLFPAYLGFIY
jgi:hypothetical protein